MQIPLLGSSGLDLMHQCDSFHLLFSSLSCPHQRRECPVIVWLDTAKSDARGPTSAIDVFHVRCNLSVAVEFPGTQVPKTGLLAEDTQIRILKFLLPKTCFVHFDTTLL